MKKRSVALVVAWIIVLIFGILEILFVYRNTVHRYTRRVNSDYIIGNCANRLVKAHLYFPNGKEGFAISVNNHLVYTEEFRTNTTNLAFIIHFENGIQKYITVFDDNGKEFSREVEYFKENNQEVVVYDNKLNGNFFNKLRYLTDTNVQCEKLSNMVWTVESIKQINQSNNPVRSKNSLTKNDDEKKTE